MEKKTLMAILFAVCLFGATLVGLTAKALPNHIVAGGVFGPGNDVSPGPTNPANAVDMVFYSTSQPSYVLITGPDSFTQADGTDPAIYARDVGNIWDWLDGDEMVVVFETLRGVSGWTSVNHTTSTTAILDISASPVQDIGNVTLEIIPTLTLSAGFDWANITWSPLTDTSNNVQSYNVYRADSPAGPFVAVGSVVHAPGAKYFNDTGLSSGQVCYRLSVNYRRDNIGGLYETTGRSEIMCGIITGALPTITNTDPYDGEVDVALDKDIVVTFSEQMDTATVMYQITPSITLSPTWTVGDTVLTLSHTTLFTICQSYIIDISGKDMDGNDLVPTPTTWSFTALCDLPFIVSTSPADGASEVRVTTSIVVTFSEEMQISTVTNSSNPSITLISSWNSPTNTVLTLTPAPSLAAGTSYQITIAGQDLDGNDLISGPVSNPWTFTTNNPPTAVLDPSSTLLGRCCNGGADLAIPWTMSDVETPLDQLIVWLNYTIGATTTTIAGPLTGRTSPDSYLWTTPTVDDSATIWLEVIDGAGDSAQDSSASVTIDSTAPYVQSVTPSEGSTNVPTDAQVVVTFSEPMNKTTVTVSFTPTVSNVQLTWDATNTTSTVAHAEFQASTQYTLTVNATAKDSCSPGNEMGLDDTTTFTTGTGPKAPMPPTNLATSEITYNSVALTWNAPTQYTDGSSLPPSEIASYKVYRAISSTGQKTVIGTVNTTTYTDDSVEQERTYYYWVTAVDTRGWESNFSNQVSADVPKESVEGEIPWLWILIAIIIILVIIGLILLLRRKKPEAVPPEALEVEEVPAEPEAAPEVEPPPEEAPPEEAPPEEAPPEGTKEVQP